MHQLIYALVEAQSENRALDAAKRAFDRLAGRTEVDEGVFDYYVTFDMDGHSVAGRSRWGDLPEAAAVESSCGIELVERGWRVTVAEFERNLELVEETLCIRSPEEVMADENLVRHACRNLGAYRGPAIFLYDHHGDGIRTRAHLEHVLDTDATLWVVPADVHY